MTDQAGGHRTGRAEHLDGDPVDLAAGSRRHQDRAALLLLVQPGHDRRQPGAAREPEAQRLADADAADPGVVEAGLAGREQPAAQVPGPVRPRVRELEPEVRQQVADHRQRNERER